MAFTQIPLKGNTKVMRLIIFTVMFLVDDFIQKMNFTALKEHFFQSLHSLRIEHMTLALLVPCLIIITVNNYSL